MVRAQTVYAVGGYAIPDFASPDPIGSSTPNSGQFTSLSATVSTNGVAGTTTTNSNSGSSAVSAYSAYNDGGNFSFFGTLSSAYSLSDLFGPNYGALFSTGKLSITTSSTDILFGVGGTSLIATINTSGITANLGYTFNAYAASGAPFSMGGKLNVNTTAVGNVGAGTDDLMTYSLPADVLGSNGKGVRITAWGTTANNANAKTVAILFGASSLGSLALTTNNAGRWRVMAEIIRTGSNAQTYNINIGNGLSTSSLLGYVNQCADITETDTAGITIKCTGVGVADNDIVQKGMIVEFIS